MYFHEADAPFFFSLSKRKNLKKQIPPDSFHGKPTKYMGVRVNTRAATKITWQTLSPRQDFFYLSVRCVGSRRWFRVQPPALGKMESRDVRRAWPYKFVLALYTQPPHSQASFSDSLLCSSAELMTERRFQMPS